MFDMRESYSQYGKKKLWRVDYDKQRDDGTVFRTCKRGFKTKGDAKEWIVELKKKLSQGINVDKENVSLSVYLDRWFEIHTVKKASNTRASYKNNIRHIKNFLGGFKLCELNGDMVQKFYNEFALLSNGNGGMMSAEMLDRVHTTFNQAMKRAVKDGLILRNPCEGTDRGVHEKGPRLYCTADQLLRFIKIAKAEAGDYYLPLLICALTATRRGEALGIKRDSLTDVRFEIRGQITRDNLNKGSVYKEYPKTSKSIRSLKIPSELRPVIKSQLRKQAEERLSMGDAYHDSGFLCAPSGGGFLSPNEISRIAKILLREADIDPRIHLHDLRHSVATLLRQAGVKIEIISAILGHSNVKTTYDFYIGDDTQAADDATDQVGTIIGLTKIKSKKNASGMRQTGK